MADKIKISVVMPSFNEEKAVVPMIEAVRKHSAAFETEILLVDSSRDKTPELARSLGARVIQQKPQGHGIALRTALGQAAHDIVITSDCDNTYPMEFIPELVRLITEEGCDIISCNRLHKNLGKEMPFMNKAGNRLFAFLVRLVYGLKVRDVTTGMFCARKSVIDAIQWETNYSFPCELIVRSTLAGFRHREVDIPYRFRLGEVTLNKWRSGKAYLRCIFNYRFNLGINPEAM
jgi:glycosyltransferase involved in cell wall biosynthesis